MEWVTRIIGVLAIFGLTAWSVNLVDETIFAEPSVTVEASAPASDDPEAEGSQIDGSELVIKPREPRTADAPEYLAYGPGLDPGLYQVSNLPGSDDRDNELDDDDDDEDDDDPDGGLVEYDLVPGQSLAPKGKLAPGLYATPFGVEKCGYELRRIMKDQTEQIIGQDYLHQGRMLVEINEIEPDSFLSLPGCTEWIPWSKPTKPIIEADNGDYWTGDLARGGWVVPDGCFWEKVVSHRGAELYDVTDSGIGPGSVVIDDSTRGLRVRGCSLPLVHGAFAE